MTTYSSRVYLCPKCRNEIDMDALIATSSGWWPGGIIPENVYAIAYPEEIGCRVCGTFFLLETAELAVNFKRKLYSHVSEECLIPTSLSAEERKRIELRQPLIRRGGNITSQQCICNNPLCSKCLLIQCMDDMCKIHTQEKKLARRKTTE